MLEEFTKWIESLQGELENQFDVEIVQHEKYFTKISIDSDEYISQITFWDNRNLYEAEILSVLSGKTIFILTGEMKEHDSFHNVFEKFFKTIEFNVI